MTTISQGKPTFSFPATCQASQYDKWSFHRCQFQSVAGGCRAIDILCVHNGVSWLIEVKDYRRHPCTKPVCIADELAIKARDTLAGLAAAAKIANDANEQQHAKTSLRSRTWRVALHLEQPPFRTRLRPKPIDTASVLQKLKSRKLKAIDAHPIICGQNQRRKTVPWSVQ